MVEIPLLGGESSFRFGAGSQLTSGIVAEGKVTQSAVIVDLKLGESESDVRGNPDSRIPLFPDWGR